MGMQDRYMTSAAVADLLHRHRATVRRWAADGAGPPAIRMGRELRWRESDVLRWLASLPTASGRREEIRITR